MVMMIVVVLLFLISNNHIYRAAEVITAFVDKQGALVVIFEGETSRKLFHDDPMKLAKLVTQINNMKNFATSG